MIANFRKVPPPQPRRLLTAVFAMSLIFGVPDSRGELRAGVIGQVSSELVSDGTADGEPERETTNAPQSQPTIAIEIFENYLFGATGSNAVAAARNRLELTLLERIDTVDGDCQLSETQRAKLRLAGKGDIKRIFDRVDAVRRELPLVSPEQVTPAVRAAISREVNPLRARFESGLFHADSLYAKTATGILTAAQRDRCHTMETIERLGGKIGRRKNGQRVLITVTFAAVPLTDDELGALMLANLPNLTGLFLYETNVTDRGLKHIQSLTQLEQLQLSHMDITDSGLETLRDLTNLKSLILTDIPITNAGLEHLLSLTRLEHLRIPERSAGDALQQLQEMESLRFLLLQSDSLVVDCVRTNKQVSIPISKRQRPK